MSIEIIEQRETSGFNGQLRKIKSYLIVVALTVVLIIIMFITNSAVLGGFFGFAAGTVTDPIIWPICLLLPLWQRPGKVLLLILIYAVLARIYIIEVVRVWEVLGVPKDFWFQLPTFIGPVIAASLAGIFYSLLSYCFKKYLDD